MLIGRWAVPVFPNLSAIEMDAGEAVYENEIAPDMEEYLRECFAGVCTEYLKLMGQYGRLKSRYTVWGAWYGKTGCIDITAVNPNGETLAGFCRFDNTMVSKAEMEGYRELLELAMLHPQELYLFSKAGFSDEVRKMAETEQEVQLVLVGLEDL